jgi:hypothetical protein
MLAGSQPSSSSSPGRRGARSGRVPLRRRPAGGHGRLVPQALPRGTPVRPDGALRRWPHAPTRDAIEFYGYGMDTRYSGSAVYWLTTGSARARIPTGPAAAGAATVSHLLAPRDSRAADLVGAAVNGDAEKFFGRRSSQPRQEDLHPRRPGRRRNRGAARGRPAGVTDVPHSVSVAVNRLPVGTVDFQGVGPESASLTLPPGPSCPATTSSSSSRERARTSRSSSPFASSTRARRPRHGSARLHARGWNVDPSRRLRIPAHPRLDVTDPDAPVRLESRLVRGAVVAAAGTARATSSPTSMRTPAAPASVLPNRPSSWPQVRRGPRHRRSLGAARRGAAPGGSPSLGGLRVALVDIEGRAGRIRVREKSVDAVRAFLQRALQSWNVAPRYLLLLGWPATTLATTWARGRPRLQRGRRRPMPWRRSPTAGS